MISNQKVTERYAMYHGDAVEVARGLLDNSIDLSIHSPPFSNLYIYSADPRDMGNTKNDEEFFEHYKFLIPEMLRITKPGRIAVVHCKDLPLYAGRDGAAGLKDFPGRIIREFEDSGWTYHSRVTIWKDPVIEMQRTKAHGLLHRNFAERGEVVRQGCPDYLLMFRKWVNEMPDKQVKHSLVPGEYVGENIPTVYRDDRDYSIQVWQRYASPVWYDIKQTNVLNIKQARDSEDEKHICLAKGSRVLTYQNGYKPIEDIELGDLVLTHKGRWMPVIAKEKTSESADVVKIRATGVHDLTVTPTHKLWARSGKGVVKAKDKAQRTEPDWIEAKDLEDTYVNLKLPPVEKSNLSEREWWIIGRWIADGHIDQRGVAHISCGNSKLKKLLNNLGDLASTMRKQESCTQVAIKDKGKHIRKVLELCGTKAHLKCLPPEAMRLNKTLSRALLDGYLSGDGHFNLDRKRWSASSASKDLLLGLQIIIQRVHGVTSTIHTGRPAGKAIIQGRTVNTHDEWILSFQPHGYSFSFIKEDGAWKKVKSVEKAGKAETWNIRVAEDASYTAEGCIVKNCPLQLDVIGRCIHLWSNPDDVVYDPFSGLGSTGYEAIKMQRRYIGSELKDSYYQASLDNLDEAEMISKQAGLFV